MKPALVVPRGRVLASSLLSHWSAPSPADVFSSQVNHSPSFSTDSKLDKEVKDSLLYDALVLINLGNCDKKKVLEEERQRGRFLQQCPNREIRYSRAPGSRQPVLILPGPQLRLPVLGRVVTKVC